MGARKKEAARRERQGTSTDGMANVKVKGENFYRYVKELRTVPWLLLNKYTEMPKSYER